MPRCRETAGILFRKQCQETATHTCASCQKPVCVRHARNVRELGFLCITCGRKRVCDPNDRSVAYLQDDPYFYWYAQRHHLEGDEGYSDADFALFDSPSSDFGSDADFDSQWEGS